MSQYPPYPPPNYQAPPQPTPEELAIPARRAGTMMIILGAMAVVFGLFKAYDANTFDPAAFNTAPQVRAELDRFVAALEAVGLSLRGFMLFGAAFILGVGAVMGALGFGVRGGRLVPAVLSIVLVVLLLLFLGLIALAQTLQAAASGAPQLMILSCFPTLLVGLLAWLLVALIQAARAAPLLEAARQRQTMAPGTYGSYPMYYPQHPGTPPAGDPPPSGGGYHGVPTAPPPPQPPGEKSDGPGTGSPGPPPQA